MSPSRLAIHNHCSIPAIPLTRFDVEQCSSKQAIAITITITRCDLLIHWEARVYVLLLGNL